MIAAQPTPYLPLEPSAKGRVIAGASLLWFYNLIFSFAMPVVLPTLMGTYSMMGSYAILSGITALLLCIATPIGGKLGDRFGRRRVCLLAGSLRLALMLFCAIPTSGPVFFAAYVAGNLLGGILSAFPSAILADVTMPEERPRWFGLFGTINGAALFLGMLCGGIIVDLLGAFSVFLLFAPFGLISLILFARHLPNRPAETPTPIDVIGILLLGSSFACILTWCAFGGSLFPRLSPLGVSLLIVGTALLGLLLFAESRAKDPLLDLRLFRSKPFSMSFSAYLLIAPMMCLCSSLLVLFGQISLGLPAIVSGTLAMPKNIMFLLLPPVLGVWIAKDHRRFRPAFLICGAAITVASLIASFWNTTTPLPMIYLTMLIFGIGSCFQAVTIQPYMQVSVEAKDMGIASAMILFSNSIGIALFNAVYNIFYNSNYAAVVSGSGQSMAQAIANTFSAMCVLSAICGFFLIVSTLIFVPRNARKSKA